MTNPSPAPDQDLLAALDPDQREVAETLTGPLCVLAGAGTGKTRAITYRIAHGVRTGVYDPHSILAVTFTARAAGEMRSRLRDLGANGVQARTFHAAALRQLKYFYPRVIGGDVPPIAPHKASLVAEAAGRLGLGADRVSVRDLAAEVEWSKVSLITPEDYPARASRAGKKEIAGYDLDTVGRLIEIYESAKAERGVIDFEDVLLLMVGILRDHDNVARQIRDQYRRFVVDEYQDVSPLQQRLLELWQGDRNEVCVVGDVSQTIYSFTGATSAFLTGFTKRYTGAKVIELVRDYRSTPQVVGLANDLLAKAGPERNTSSVELIAHRPSSVPVSYDTYDDDDAEAAGVVEKIQELHRQGVPLSEIAVLFRTHGQSPAIEQALSTSGIGYTVSGGERFFARREVRDALVILRGAARSMAAHPLGETVRDLLQSTGWSATAPTSTGAVRERWESLNSLVTLADDMEKARAATLSQFIAELDDRAEAQHAPTVEGVTLASLHAAKGLEWDAVFIVGASDGLLPISLAEGADKVAEERRLLYVGVTRAREHLTLSYAKARTAGGRATRKRSRFLTGIWPTEQRTVADRLNPGRSRRARARAAHDDFAADHPADMELFERLRTWRGEVAEFIKKPPYTVLHDTTLRSVAVVKPQTLSQLAVLRGIGQSKLDAYGEQVLAVVRGDDVDVAGWISSA